nr:S-layer homology domain-containing protein [Paenibacillus sp. Marseille-Q4541]
MLLGSLGSVEAAQKGNDLEGHWARSQIQDWINNGNLNGYEDGSVKPNKTISRAEFISLINRSFGYNEASDISFEDLASTNWAYTDIAKAVKAGYVQGYENNTFRPGANVTRQEAAVMISKLLGVQNNNYDVLNQFVDRETIANWSKAAVASVVEQEVMKGYPNDTFAPLRSLTRAEAVVLIDNALASKKELSTITYDEAGIYGSETKETVIEGNVIINVPGVTLQNTVIKGDLLFAKGIGAGDVTIKNVKVHGTTNVEGGGENSIHLVDSVLLNIVVNKKDGTVRIVAEGTTTTQNVVVKSSVKLEEDKATGAGFTDVELSKELPKNSKVVLNGSFDDVDIYATSMSVELVRGSIENMQIDKAALDNAITISSNAKVIQLVLDAITKLLGSGTINKAIVNEGAAGSSFESKPGQLEGAQKDNVTVPVAPPVSGGGGTSGGGGGSTPTPVVVDKSTLFQTLLVARELNESVEVGTAKGEVDQDSKNVFASAIANADIVYLDSSATQSTVDQANTKLSTAITVFESAIIKEDTDQKEELKAEKQQLFSIILEANNLNDHVSVGEKIGDVSQSAKDQFTSAIQVAEAVYADEAAEVATVINARADLSTAITTFKNAIIKEDLGESEVEIAKQALFSTIEEAKGINLGISVGNEVGQVSQSAKDQFDGAISVAESVYANESSSVYEVNLANENLNASIKEFRAAVITDEQKEAEAILAAKQVLFSNIEIAVRLNNQYEAGSQLGQVPVEEKDAFENVITVSRAVYDNLGATLTEVQTSNTDLQSAIKKFEASVIEEVEVATVSELRKAVAIDNNKIKLTENIVVDSEGIEIHGQNVQINGNTHTISWSDETVSKFVIFGNSVSISNVTFENSNDYNLHVYKAEGVVLTDVSFKNSKKGGLLVNGAEVTVENVTTEGNEWGGIEVSKGVEVTSNPVLTIKGTSKHPEDTAIWTDPANNNDNPQIVDVNNQYRKLGPVSGFYTYVLKDSYQTVNTLAEFELAVSLDNNKVKLGADLVGAESVRISGANVEIDGANHSISITGKGNKMTVENNGVKISNLTVKDSSEYNLHVYNAEGVVLENVTLNNSKKGGLLVNGSKVTVRDITTSNNSWGGIEVAKGSAENLSASTLTVEGKNTHSENVAIWTVNPNGEGNQVVDEAGEYRSYEDARPGKKGYTNYILNNAYQVVNTFDELSAAVKVNNNKVMLGSDIAEEGKVLELTGENVTLHGGSKTLSLTDANNSFLITGNGATIVKLTVKDSAKYNVHVYNAQNVKFDYVTFENADNGGLLINGSTVTVSNITTSNNKWGGIEVSKGSAENLSASTLTVEGTNKHSEDVAIWTVNPNNEGNSVVDEANQYHASADTRQGKEGYTNYSAYQVVNTFEELSAAVKVDNNKIKLGTSITETGKLLEVIGSNVVIEGNNKTLSLKEAGNSFLIFGSGTKVMNLTVANSAGYNVQVYNATDVVLDNVTLDSSKKGGLLVNSASVTVNKIITKGNAWGGIEVSKGVNVQEQPSLTITGTSKHDEAVAIWTDPANGSVPVVNDVQSQYEVNDATDKEGFKYYTLKSAIAE